MGRPKCAVAEAPGSANPGYTIDTVASLANVGNRHGGSAVVGVLDWFACGICIGIAWSRRG
jgi:hypothetical protein